MRKIAIHWISNTNYTLFHPMDKAIHSLKNWGQGCPTYEFTITCDYRNCMISLGFGRTSYMCFVHDGGRWVRIQYNI